MSEIEALKAELAYWQRVIGDRMGANDRRFSDMVRDLKDTLRASAPTRQTHQAKGALTDADLRHFAECARAMCEQRCGPLLTISVEGGIKIEKLIAEVERLRAYEVELRRIAEDLGEPNDPFAAWEKLAGRQRSAAMTVEPASSRQWPAPKVTNPDIASPTGVPYLDCLIHRVLDAQQDINYAANEGMNQNLADAAELLDEVETALRTAAASPPRTTAMTAEPAAYRWRFMSRGEWSNWVMLSLEAHADHMNFSGEAVKDGRHQIEPLYAAPPSSGNADAVRAALKPFAEMAEHVSATHRDDRPIIYGIDTAKVVNLTIGDLRRAAASLSSAPVAGEWQDISTAPKDGNAIMVCDDRTLDGCHQVVFWNDDHANEWKWDTSDGPSFHADAFTHWKPLDPPPHTRNDRATSQLNTGEKS